jgi:cell division septation protein DedD
VQSAAESAKPEAIKSAMSRPEVSKPPIIASTSPTHSIRAATASSSASASRVTAPGSWSVQLGLFAKRENAERMAHDAQAKGFSVAISNPDASGLFHVRAVGLQDRAAAQTLSQRMQAQGIKCAVVPP